MCLFILNAIINLKVMASNMQIYVSQKTNSVYIVVLITMDNNELPKTTKIAPDIWNHIM